ncbi:MAG: hypothetical protein Q8P18_15745 [Pseudomonadota bacterium]|nr:hypothetical protein [Pseudomonadota bacterium]
MFSLLLLWSSAWLAVGVHLSVVAAVGRALGAQVEAVRFGSLGRLRLRDTAPDVSLGLLPGGFVQFVGAGDPTADGYEQLPRWRRAFIPVTGPLVVLGLAAAVLGPDGALGSALRAPAQLFSILDPFGAAPVVLDAANAALLQPPAWIIGTLLAKVAAFNLLPFPTLATGQALLALVPLPERLRVLVNGLAAVAVAALFFGWVLACGAWLYRG